MNSLEKNTAKNHPDRQQGSAMILSIMVMMGLGIIALNALQQQLSAGLALTSNQHRYVIAWENAASSLSWESASPGRRSVMLSGNVRTSRQSLLAPDPGGYVYVLR